MQPTLLPHRVRRKASDDGAGTSERRAGWIQAEHIEFLDVGERGAFCRGQLVPALSDDAQESLAIGVFMTPPDTAAN